MKTSVIMTQCLVIGLIVLCMLDVVDGRGPGAKGRGKGQGKGRQGKGEGPGKGRQKGRRKGPGKGQQDQQVVFEVIAQEDNVKPLVTKVETDAENSLELICSCTSDVCATVKKQEGIDEESKLIFEFQSDADKGCMICPEGSDGSKCCLWSSLTNPPSGARGGHGRNRHNGGKLGGQNQPSESASEASDGSESGSSESTKHSESSSEASDGSESGSSESTKHSESSSEDANKSDSTSKDPNPSGGSGGETVESVGETDRVRGCSKKSGCHKCTLYHPDGTQTAVTPLILRHGVVGESLATDQCHVTIKGQACYDDETDDDPAGVDADVDDAVDDDAADKNPVTTGPMIGAAADVGGNEGGANAVGGGTK